jgi:hypothetical protein
MATPDAPDVETPTSSAEELPNLSREEQKELQLRLAVAESELAYRRMNAPLEPREGSEKLDTRPFRVIANVFTWNFQAYGMRSVRRGETIQLTQEEALALTRGPILVERIREEVTV